MVDEGAERERRIRQFERVPRIMSALRRGDEGGDAYLILDELRPGDGPGKQMKQSVVARRELSLAAAVGGASTNHRGAVEWGESGAEHGEDDGAPRFV